MAEIRLDPASGRRLLVEGGLIYHPKDALEWKRLEADLGQWDYPMSDEDTRLVRALLNFWNAKNNDSWEIDTRPDLDRQNEPTPDFKCREATSGRVVLIEEKCLTWDTQGAKWDKGFVDFYSDASRNLTNLLPGAYLLISLGGGQLDFSRGKRDQLLLEFQQKALKIASEMQPGEVRPVGPPFHVSIKKVSSNGSYLEITGRFQDVTTSGLTSEMRRLLSQANKKFPKEGETLHVMLFTWPYRGDLQNPRTRDAIHQVFSSLEGQAYSHIDQIHVCSDGLGHGYGDIMQLHPEYSDTASVKVADA